MSFSGLDSFYVNSNGDLVPFASTGGVLTATGAGSPLTIADFPPDIQHTLRVRRQITDGSTTDWMTSAPVLFTNQSTVPGGNGDPTGVQAQWSDLLVDTIGFNTHWHYTDRKYHTAYAQVRDALVASGVRYYRDYTMPTKQSTYVELAGLGLKMTAVQSIETEVSGVWRPAETITLDQTMDVAQAVHNAGGLIGIEAVNEPDISSSLDTPTWSAAARDHLADIVAGRAARGMTSVPVIAPGMTWIYNYDTLGNITQWTNIANIHPYTGGWAPESGRIDADKAEALLQNTPGGQVWATEVGFTNDVPSSGGHKGTPETQAGIYYVRQWLYNFKIGIKKSFGYEFWDQGTDGEQMLFGVIRNDGTPKLAYTATKNLIELLEDPGTPFQAEKLDYTLTGTNSSVEQVLLQKRDGSFWLAIWMDTSIWNPDTMQTLNPGDLSVTMTTGSARAINRYTPTISTSSQQSGTGAGFTFTVSEVPQLIKVV